MKFKISADKSDLNLEFIWRYLSNDAYWAKGRNIDVVKKSIENSICFGAYLDDGTQIGFARVVSDKAVFAWVLDLFVADDYQKKGVGKSLMDAIIIHPDLQDLKRWGLCTADAHGLYKQYGFTGLIDPEIHMERILQ